MEHPIIWPQNLRFESDIYSKHQTSRQTDRPGGRPLRRCAGAAAPVSCARRCALVFLPFQIHAAESRFVKPFIRISKTGSHLLMDDCPTNRNLIIHRINLISRTFARSPSRKKSLKNLQYLGVIYFESKFPPLVTIKVLLSRSCFIIRTSPPPPHPTAIYSGQYLSISCICRSSGSSSNEQRHISP